jgi:hypothetical protein
VQWFLVPGPITLPWLLTYSEIAVDQYIEEFVSPYQYALGRQACAVEQFAASSHLITLHSSHMLVSWTQSPYAAFCLGLCPMFQCRKLDQIIALSVIQWAQLPDQSIEQSHWMVKGGSQSWLWSRYIIDVFASDREGHKGAPDFAAQMTSPERACYSADILP